MGKKISKAALDWAKTLEDQELPVFSHTARNLTSVSTYQTSSAVELAETILLDASMTARLLQMANSNFYNPMGQQVDTVSYAIVLLGFDAVRNLAFSIALVDTALSGHCKQQAMDELVVSVCAGVQSKRFAERVLDGKGEDVFIGAMLRRLGAIAFWCYPNGYDEALIEQYRIGEEQGMTRAECETAVLGFTFDELTLALDKQWHLSELLHTSIKQKDDVASGIVASGYGLADDAYKGFDHDDMKAHCRTLAKLTDSSVSDVKARAKEFQSSATALLKQHGVDGKKILLSRNPMQMPQVNLQKTEKSDKNAKPHVVAVEHNVLNVALPKSTDNHNAEAILGISREVSRMMVDQVPLPTLLSAIVEGIYRTLSMGVVLLASYDEKNAKLVAKHGVGDAKAELIKQFQFPVSDQHPHAFSALIEAKQALCWRESEASQAYLMQPIVKDKLGGHDFMAAPLLVKGKVKAVIYADRRGDEKPFTSSDFDAFKHFMDLASVSLTLHSQLSK